MCSLRFPGLANDNSMEEHRKARERTRRAEWTTPARCRVGRFVGVRRVSARGDERLGHATRRPVIVGVLVSREVRAGTDAGRTRTALRPWPSPNFSHPKSDGPHFGFREQRRRSGESNGLVIFNRTDAQMQRGRSSRHRLPVVGNLYPRGPIIPCLRGPPAAPATIDLCSAIGRIRSRVSSPSCSTHLAPSSAPKAPGHG